MIGSASTCSLRPTTSWNFRWCARILLCPVLLLGGLAAAGNALDRPCIQDPTRQEVNQVAGAALQLGDACLAQIEAARRVLLHHQAEGDAEFSSRQEARMQAMRAEIRVQIEALEGVVAATSGSDLDQGGQVDRAVEIHLAVAKVVPALFEALQLRTNQPVRARWHRLKAFQEAKRPLCLSPVGERIEIRSDELRRELNWSEQLAIHKEVRGRYAAQEKDLLNRLLQEVQNSADLTYREFEDFADLLFRFVQAVPSDWKSYPGASAGQKGWLFAPIHEALDVSALEIAPVRLNLWGGDPASLNLYFHVPESVAVQGLDVQATAHQFGSIERYGLGSVSLHWNIRFPYVDLPRHAQWRPGAEAQSTYASGVPDEFLGRWSIRYQDQSLGEVQGEAVVRRDRADPRVTHVRVLLSDPANGDQYELHATRVFVRGDHLMVQLWGASPSPGQPQAQRTAQGDEVVPSRIQGLVELTFPLQALLEAGELRLDGSWSARSNAGSNWNGLRSSSQWDRTASGDPTGSEVWIRQGVSISEVAAVELADYPDLLERADDAEWLPPFWLRIRGRGLPREGLDPCDVAFEQDTIRYLGEFRADPALDGAVQVRCVLHRNVRPGRINLRLNGAPATWDFDFPGNLPQAVRFVRLLENGEREPLSQAIAGELVYVQVEFAHQPHYQSRQLVLRVPGADSLPFDVDLVATDEEATDGEPSAGFTFRSRPLLLLSNYESVPNEVERLWVVPVPLNRPLRAVLIDGNAATTPLPAAEVTVLARPGSEWLDAMQLATENHSIHPDRYVDRWLYLNPVETWGRPPSNRVQELLERVSLVPVVRGRTTTMSVEDHAACILLRHELVRQLREYATSAQGVPPRTLSGEIHPDYMQGEELLVQGLLHMAAESNFQHPLLLFEVFPPSAAEDRIPLSEALHPQNLEATFGSDTAAQFRFARRAVRQAQRAAGEAAATSLVELAAIELEEPFELLLAVSAGYPAIVLPLAQRLMRPSTPGLGEPTFPSWVPDAQARRSLKALGILSQHVKAEEDYANLSEDFMALVANLPLLFASLPATLAARAGVAASSGAQAAARISQIGLELLDFVDLALEAERGVAWLEAETRADIALGGAVVSGDVESYFASRNEADAGFLGLVTSAGMSQGPRLFGQAVAYGMRPSRRAMQQAGEKVLRRGLASLNAEERAVFDFLRGRAAHRLGSDLSLDALDELAVRADYPRGLPPELAQRLGVDPVPSSALDANPTTTVDANPTASLDANGISIPGHEPLIPAAGQVVQPVRGHRSNGGRYDPDATLDHPHQNDVFPQDAGGRVPFVHHPELQRIADQEATLNLSQLARLERRQSLVEVERTWQRLDLPARGRVSEAMEIWQRLGQQNPALAQIDPAEAMRLMSFHARGSQPGSTLSHSLTPQDLVSRVAAWNRVPLRESALARGANSSALEAEIALGQAERWAGRFEARGAPQGPLPPAAIQVQLEHFGLGPLDARLRAAVAQSRGVDGRVATVGAAFDGYQGPGALRASLEIGDAEIRRALHEYLDRVRLVRDEATRQRFIDGFMARPDNVTRPPPVALDGDPPDLLRPLGPSGETLPPGQASAYRELRRTGLPPMASRQLSAEAQSAGINPEVAAIGAAFDHGAGPGALPAHLAHSDLQIRRALDEYLATSRNIQDSVQRQRLVEEFMARDEVTLGGSSTASGGGLVEVDGVPASRQEASMFQQYVEFGESAVRARALATRASADGLSGPAAAAGYALENQKGPAFLRQHLGIEDAQIRQDLDAYLSSKGVHDFVDRRLQIVHFMRREGDGSIPSGTETLIGANPGATSSPNASMNRVQDLIGDLVPDRGRLAQLDFDFLVQQRNLDAREISAVTGMALDLDPRVLALRLSPGRENAAAVTELGRLLDRGFRATDPEVGAMVRAEAIASYFRGAEIPGGARFVFEGRNVDIAQQLRHLGGRRIDMLAVYKGIEVETAVVGQAWEQFIPAQRVMDRRRLDPEALRGQMDRYWRLGQGIEDAEQRAHLWRSYVEGSHQPPPPRSSPPLERAEVLPQASFEEIGRSLEVVGVPAEQARAVARSLWDVAWDDPYMALAAAAFRRDIPPGQLAAVGLNRAQTINLIERHLQVHMRLGDMRKRSELINDYLERSEGQRLSPREFTNLVFSAEARRPQAPYRAPRAEEVALTSMHVRPLPQDPFAETSLHMHQPGAEGASSNDLDQAFGPSQPVALVHARERGMDGLPLTDAARVRLSEGARLPELDQDARYLWLVDEEGVLVLGGGRQAGAAAADGVPNPGHASLAQGRPVRIAGEMQWSSRHQLWVLSNRGAAHSAHPQAGVEQLQNAAGLFSAAGLQAIAVRFDFASNPWALGSAGD